MREAALKLARSLPLFPCRDDKSPYTGNGFKDATQDSQRIEHWWTRWPDALIGVPCGPKFCVIDCDLQHPEARDWYSRANIPTTRIHTTRSGGRHILFRPNDAVGCTASKIWKHVDTRGANNGYVIWWPSCGYGVQHGGVLADVPDWIIARLGPKEDRPRVIRTIDLDGVPAKVGGIIRAITDALEGERNKLLFWGACRLRELADQHLIPRDDAFDIALEAARRTGLPYGEALKTVRSAFQVRS